MTFNPKDTICRDLWAYPVIELTLPKVRTCCKRQGDVVTNDQLNSLGTDVFLNLPNTQEERKEMMLGEQIEGCRACWDNENSGQPSVRLGKLDWQFHFNNDKGAPVSHQNFRPFEKLIQQSTELLKSDKPNKLDVVMGTYCDQKCVYCCADFSTQWETEDAKFGSLWNDPRIPKIIKNKIPINNQTINNWYETFIEWFDGIHQHLERIALLGGEPTFSPMFVPLSEHIIKKLNESHHPNCTLSIVTNMNWKKDVLDQILKIRKELPKEVKVVIEASMESVGEKAEYIRKGVDWNRFYHNLKSVIEDNNLDVVLVPTINSLSVTSFIDYLKEVKKLEDQFKVNFKIIANMAVFPKWLSISALDSSFKPYIQECVGWLKSNYDINDHKKKDILSLLENINIRLDQPVDTELIGYSIVWIQELDRRRSSNFLETFPEYSDFINNYSQYIEPTYTEEHMKKWSY